MGLLLLTLFLDAMLWRFMISSRLVTSGTAAVPNSVHVDIGFRSARLFALLWIAGIIALMAWGVFGLWLFFTGPARRKARSAAKRQPHTLYTNEEQIAGILKYSPSIIFLKDINGKYLLVNQRYEEIFHISNEEIHGKTDFDIFPEGIAETFRKNDQRVISAGEIITIEETVLHDDGMHNYLVLKFPVRNPEGAITAVCGIATDVTTRKQAEIERERLMAAIEQAAETIVITDARANIEYVNPAFEQITGYTRGEAIGQNPRILKSGKQDAAFYKDMWNTLLSGQTWNGQLVNKKKDGSLYIEDVTISPVHDAMGKIVNYVAVKRDITHEVEIEDQLRQAQKMEAVGQLAGGIAHDFNNLLQVITGYTDMAIKETSPDSPLHEDLTEVSVAANRASELIHQLLAFSRRQVIQPVELDLNDVIEQLLKMIHRLISEHIKLDFMPGDQLGVVYADRGQIEQVLTNLCINARDAMPNGGTLTIETKNIVIDEDYVQHHPGTQSGPYILLEVTDTGCGIPQNQIKNIFDPFFTTKDVGKGTGMGLATVYGIIKQHHGHINIYSEPDKGTAFKIYLPLVERKAVKTTPEKQQSVRGGTETILVAEDEPTVLGLAARILRDAGYTVLTASDGQEAVRIFNDHADEIDLTLFDVVMPRMGGKEALEKIHEIRPGLPHIFASGYSKNIVHTDFIQDHNLSLICKPYRTATLLGIVRKVLDENK